MREVVWSVLNRVLWTLSQSEDDLSKAAHDATLLAFQDALPVSAVSKFVFLIFYSVFLLMNVLQAVSVVHTILCRMVDSRLLSTVTWASQALNVPIVGIDDLIDFFKSTEVGYLNLIVYFYCNLKLWKTFLKQMKNLILIYTQTLKVATNVAFQFNMSHGQT